MKASRSSRGWIAGATGSRYSRSAHWQGEIHHLTGPGTWLNMLKIAKRVVALGNPQSATRLLALPFLELKATEVCVVSRPSCHLKRVVAGH